MPILPPIGDPTGVGANTHVAEEDFGDNAAAFEAAFSDASHQADVELEEISASTHRVDLTLDGAGRSTRYVDLTLGGAGPSTRYVDLARDGVGAASQQPRSYTVPADATHPQRRRTEWFPTPEAALRRALRINRRSVHRDVEYGGNLYVRVDEHGNRMYGYTGPRRGDVISFNSEDPHVRVPSDPGVLYAGMYHTHGNYSDVDRPTGVNNRYVDGFSFEDFTLNLSCARGETSEERTQWFIRTFGRPPDDADNAVDRAQWFIRHYGAPPDDVGGLHFGLGTPGGGLLMHSPNRVPAAENTVARYPDTGELVGGTIVQL